MNALKINPGLPGAFHKRQDSFAFIFAKPLDIPEQIHFTKLTARHSLLPRPNSIAKPNRGGEKPPQERGPGHGSRTPSAASVRLRPNGARPPFAAAAPPRVPAGGVAVGGRWRRRLAGPGRAAMFVARSIAADHRDLIHDVSFDFHGRRMATCSSDQSVKVWDKSENGDWHCTASWKTHSGSVWRVTWAHPEFGQVLASCSFDRTAAVWEEIVGESNDKLRGQSHWVKRTTLVDSRTSVTDVKFAPKHMGLMLATCSADGVVRIYEAPDVMNLSQWSLQHEISCKLSCSCISWNPSSSRAHSPMIAVGSDDNSPNILAKVQIYEYNENTRKYAKAEALMTVTDPVHDIAFAPNLGRSFHILAVATKDVRIFTLKPLRKELTSSGGLTKFEIHIVAQFDNHNSQVWRVSWNITGTVLASSGDDGCVRLWKANYMDNWKCTGILKGNGSPVNGGSQQGIFNTSLGSANTSLQNSLNGSSASRKQS
uniref:SEH1 like nucleoporin n=5 Tax=Anatidae TaxID=8830 RepID=A0A8B9DGS9_ANSCY